MAERSIKPFSRIGSTPSMARETAGHRVDLADRRRVLRDSLHRRDREASAEVRGGPGFHQCVRRVGHLSRPSWPCSSGARNAGPSRLRSRSSSSSSPRSVQPMRCSGWSRRLGQYLLGMKPRDFLSYRRDILESALKIAGFAVPTGIVLGIIGRGHRGPVARPGPPLAPIRRRAGGGAAARVCHRFDPHRRIRRCDRLRGTDSPAWSKSIRVRMVYDRRTGIGDRCDRGGGGRGGHFLLGGADGRPVTADRDGPSFIEVPGRRRFLRNLARRGTLSEERREGARQARRAADSGQLRAATYPRPESHWFLDEPGSRSSGDSTSGKRRASYPFPPPD